MYNILSLTLEQGHCSIGVFHWDELALHTMVETLFCALLSLQTTVHFMIKTWSLSIAVRMLPEGTCSTFIVKLLSDVLTHAMLPAGCSLSQMARTSLLCLIEYMSRFEANNELMKEGCTSEYNWSVTALCTDFCAFITDGINNAGQKRISGFTPSLWTCFQENWKALVGLITSQNITSDISFLHTKNRLNKSKFVSVS